MDYLLQKAFEGATQKYTPEQMATILDKHNEAIQLIIKGWFWWGLLVTICLLILVGLGIRTEINYRKLKKELQRG